MKVGTVWTLIARVFNSLFIVLQLQADDYRPHVFISYALTFLIPVGVGISLAIWRGA